MKTIFRILIVEDELIIAEMIKEMLTDLGYTVTGIAKNFEEAIDKCQKYRPDLIMLDINLNAPKDGVEVAKYVSEVMNIPHIYLTSYSDPDTVRKAAVTAPVGYLLKPFSQEDLFTTIELFRARNNLATNTLLVKEGHDLVRLDTRDVLFIKSDNNYLDIVTDRKNYMVRNTLDRFLEEAKDVNFVRTHRSFAVNIRKIDAIKGMYLYVGQYKCPISRAHRRDILSDLGSFSVGS